ncbi:hypothetical protein HK100_010865 [Physocladia obscura]|uniref:Calcineurin-like phosphoesterase domain-containing protein n=1 Tax=Physocladia obscura TaxID=109957 RepID=A0AAD5T827_9FUNG|nr:hypothetical protein HK100_010865 [Physocladia obscura]
MLTKFFGVVALAASALAGLLTPTRGPLPWGDWNFIVSAVLYLCMINYFTSINRITHMKATTDIHGYVGGQGSNNQGQYSANFADFAVFVNGLKAQAEARNVELFVVDSGDHHDGTALSDDLNAQPVDGFLTEPVVEQVPYDILSIGNHEMYINGIIDYTAQNVSAFWGEKYLTGNTYITTNKTAAGVTGSIGQKFRKFTGSKGTSVTAFGFLYSAFAGSQGTHGYITKVSTEVTSQWFLDAVADAPDFFLLVGHVVLRNNATDLYTDWAAAVTAIRKVHATTPIVIFAGHNHIRDYQQPTKYGPNVYGLTAGRYMETVGWVALNKTAGAEVDRRYLDANVATYNYHLNQPEDTPLGNSSAYGQKILELIDVAAVDTDAQEILGTVPQDYYLTRVPWNDESSIFNVTAKLMQGTWQLPAPANPALFVINAGSLRLDLFAGPLTADAAFEASPFSDYLQVIPNIPFHAIANFSNNFEYFEANNLWKTYGRRDTITCNATVGYVTIDDLTTSGNLGDDTFHCPAAYNNNPNFGVYSPATFDSATPANQLWDIVFYDYIAEDVAGCLLWAYNISTPAAVGYNPADPTLKASDLFPMMAKKFWNNTTSTVSTSEASTFSLTASATSYVAPTAPVVSTTPAGYVAPGNLYSGASAVAATVAGVVVLALML